MSSRFDATHAALECFDAVDRPAYEALATGARSADLALFDAARRKAADKVRAAFLGDTADYSQPENVELMSVDVIRRTIRGTLLGAMLRWLP